MKGFKGTKGKWDYVYENNQFEIYHEPETNGDFITTAICENEANALLISKAPEMLEMLSLISKTESISNFCYEDIQKLIKQATEL